MNGRILLCWVTGMGLGVGAYGQTTAEIATQVRDLAQQLSQVRRELADAKQESAGLRSEVQALRQLIGATPQATPESEERELLAAKVDEQHQTKVDSGSKSRVTLSGMALLQASAVGGAVDSLDLPAMAIPRLPGQSGGSLSASVRQSILGLDVEGPTLAGAKTRGEVRVDFFGGLPGVADGAASGFVRLRTAKFVMDWTNKTLEVGQDVPFISPLSPTSLVSTAYPALASSGNLWAWTPQIHMTHRVGLTGGTQLHLTYGLMDPLTGELPAEEYARVATAGERSRMPAYAARIGIANGTSSRPAAFGVGSYYSRQNWGFQRRVDSWATTADWDFSIHPRVSISGEAYRGRAIGGLGGGVSSTVLRSDDFSNIATRIFPVNSAGGWTQLKYRPIQRWEMNAAYGLDIPFRLSRNSFTPVFAGEEPTLRRNRSAFGNVIYKPRTNLLFSIEYRRLWTAPFDAVRSRATHVSIGAGILF